VLRDGREVERKGVRWRELKGTEFGEKEEERNR